MATATGITLLFVGATSGLTSWTRAGYLRRGDWASVGGVIIGTAMTLWCAFLGLWWLGWRP